MERPLYLLDSFYFLEQFFKKTLSDRFEFVFTPPYATPAPKQIPIRYFALKNFLFLKRLYWNGDIKKFKIVHFNRPEAILAYKKIEGQGSIFEIHGFDVGFKGERYLQDLHSVPKKVIGTFIGSLIEGTIIRKIRNVDLFYCSTPDLVTPFSDWCGRKPIWLPNPVDTDMFSPDGPVTKLEGEPACFLASRVHGDKKPEVAIDIFRDHIKPKYKNATLHLIESGELVDKYRKELADPKTYFWHGYMDKPTLAAKMRGADLIFGDFSIGALSLMPMQAMAVRKPIVTLDKYELVKKEIDELPDLALKILGDRAYAEKFAEENYEYVVSRHGEKAVAEQHLENIKNYCKI